MKPMTIETQALTMQPVEDDTGLILDAQRSPAGFQALYQRWALPVYQYFYARSGDHPSAEDLTSQLFLAAYQALPRYRHQGHFAAWLFTIARNLAVEFYRKRAREVPLELAERVPGASDPAAEAARADETQRLRELIQRLPEDEQELIRLRYIAELSFGDMALVLARREDAVKKALYRLQARLQSLLEQ